MISRRRAVESFGGFLAGGILIGGALVWIFTGAGEHGQGLGRGALATPIDSFTLSGDLAQIIKPGVFVPLDLNISNANKSPLTISGLIVTVSAVDAPNATVDLPCTAADFDVTQIDKTFTVLVDGHSEPSLSDLGLPSTAWPQVGMPVDESTNQDGCKGASLSLSYTATGRVSP